MISRKLHQRPSEYLFIRDELASYCLDKAVTLFGITVEAEVQEVTSKAKTRTAADRAQQRTMDKYLYSDNEPAPGRFRDPVARTT